MKRSQSPAANPSPTETQLLNTGQSQLANQQNQLGGVGNTVGTAQNMISATAPALSRFTTPDASGTTPLRKSLTNALTSSTNASFNNAQSNVRRNALQMGLQNQPLQLGNETAVGNQRAAALAKIPGQVEQEAAPLELQAINEQTGQAGLENQLANTQLGVARTYDPQSYFSQGVGLESGRQNALNQQYLQQQQANAGLWSGLLKAGLSFIPGGSAFTALKGASAGG